MVQRPSDLRGTLQAALVATERSQADSSSSPRAAPAKFAMLRDTLQNALRAVESNQAIDKTALDGISKWVADWIPDEEDPLLDRLDEVEQQIARI